MPNIEWNKNTWTNTYDWDASGEEWSGPWGSSAAEWFTTIMPRIGAALPAKSVLELGPGFGRWTEFILRFCDTYCGIDLSEKCVSNCRERFKFRPNADFLLNDGKSLSAVSGRQFDLIFSFDSLVHADLDAMSPYITQVMGLLTEGGVAFLHHSNMGSFPGASYGHRAEDVSAEIVGDLIREHGGRVLVQERFCWGGSLLTDCFTMFCRPGDHLSFKTQDITDIGLVAVEGKLARERFRYYLDLNSEAARGVSMLKT